MCTMRDKDDINHHCGALLEDINHKFDAIMEGQQAMAHLPQKVDQIDDRLQRVESDVTVIKRAVTYQGKDHGALEKRVTKLEGAAA